MSTITSSEDSSHVRRRLLCNGAITFAVAAIVAVGSVKAQSNRESVPRIKPRARLFSEDADALH